MSRESPDYRNTIEAINEAGNGKFRDKILLTIPEVMEITGYRSRNSICKLFPVVNGRVNKAALARCLSALPK